MHHILVVEKDAAMRSLLCVLLETQSYHVSALECAAREEIEARTPKPDLLMLDSSSNESGAIEVIGRIRAGTSIPIIALSSNTTARQKLAVIEAGADDYVSKVINASELLARVRALLRWRERKGEPGESLRIGEITVSVTGREAISDAGAIGLTPLEWRVLDVLARRAGMIVTRKQITREVWGPERSEDTRSLRMCVHNLRRKLEPNPLNPRYIMTEAGIGYRLHVN